MGVVPAFFACLSGLAMSGWLYSTEEFRGDRTVERSHVALAWTIVVLVALHVAGIVVTGIVDRENWSPR